MGKFLVIVSRLIFNLLYKMFSLGTRKNEVIFVSRQANIPSYDFKALGEAFATKGYEPVYLVRKLSRKTVLSYVVHVVKEIYHLARCRICFVDRYDPVVCLLDFSYEDGYPIQGREHIEFPREPIVIQLWHAFGAYKCFGYQSLDTVEGHSRTTAELFRIHRNYSWIICTGESSRAAFAEAFSYPVDRVLNLGRPEYEALRSMRQEVEEGSPPLSVLFAPTLRKSEDSHHPFRELFAQAEDLFAELPLELVWSFHPLEEVGVTSGSQHDLLQRVSLVVTDYSSIAYEAYLLGKSVLFYVPDIAEYRVSPGLNVDPLQKAKEISFTDKEELCVYLGKLAHEELVYDNNPLENFVADVFDRKDSEPVEELVDFCLDRLTCC